MEYPNDYRDLIRRFGAQEACVDYIASIRWKDGFICSACNCKEFWRLKRLSWVCAKCEIESRVLAGTLFQDTKLPLNLWFQMIWWFMGPKNGANALSLQQNFGIGSYRTSWKILAKLRSCTVLPSRTQLKGDGEVDKAFLGGVNGKEIILIAAEKRGSASGRIRLKHAKTEKADEIQGFIIDAMELA